jgi:hypothetical protein
MNRLTLSTASRAAALLATTAVAVAATVGVSASAMAAPTTGPSASSDSPSATPGHPTLTTIQQKAASAIAQRLTSLSKAIATVNGSSVISAADKATLLGTLNGDVTGLTALGAKIAADTTAQQAATDYKTIFTGYRVYALALPQAHFAMATDALTGTVVPKLTDAQTKLAALLAGVDSGKNTPAVQAAMADLATQLAGIGTATSGLSATVLAYTPAQYDANHALLSSARQSLVTARADAKGARADIVTVTKALK